MTRKSRPGTLRRDVESLCFPLRHAKAEARFPAGKESQRRRQNRRVKKQFPVSEGGGVQSRQQKTVSITQTSTKSASVKYFLHKQKDGSLNSQNPCKKLSLGSKYLTPQL